MVALFTRPRLRDLRTVPTVPVEVDWSHPLAQWLTALWVPAVGLFTNLAGVEGGGSNPTIPLISTDVGMAASFDGASQFVDIGALPGITGPFSLFGLLMPASASVSSSGTVLLNNGTQAEWGVQFGQQNANWAVGTVTTSPLSGWGANGGTPTIGKMSAVGATCVQGGNLVLYVEGIPVATTAVSGSGLRSGGSAAIGGFSDPTQFWGGDVAMLGAWNVAMAATQAAWLAAEPFAMLRPLW